ncbi:hypothetical protein [Nannocystis sp. SCPEA4]|uniref:hypothetical protein n=1 Tax=Nannocystis sp. SCPEA4 TaxID=2996787 RepID=UPI00226EBFE9|nr:hypothetical protein [Nannocystis sp. SCPEA4]MCY1059280.1 hypothetical protein [Nannocystis sp. SCPEA4]
MSPSNRRTPIIIRCAGARAQGHPSTSVRLHRVVARMPRRPVRLNHAIWAPVASSADDGRVRLLDTDAPLVGPGARWRARRGPTAATVRGHVIGDRGVHPLSRQWVRRCRRTGSQLVRGGCQRSANEHGGVVAAPSLAGVIFAGVNEVSRARLRASSSATLAVMCCLAACTTPATPTLRGGSGSAEFSTEFPLIEPVPGAAPGSVPSIAFGGDRYLAVWRDYRTLRPQLRGARIGLDGELLAPTGFLVRDVADTYGAPSVGSDGTDFLVVMPAGDGPIHATRVLADGTVVDLDGFLLASDGGEGALAFDGTNYLYAWARPASIHAARVSPSGQILDTGEVPVLKDFFPSSVDVAFDGQQYLVVWRRETEYEISQIESVRLGVDGALVDPVPFTISPVGLENARGPAVGFDGTNHVVVWSRRLDGGPTPEKLLASRVTPAGVVLDPGGVLLAEYHGNLDDFNRIDVTANNAGATVAWSRDGSDDGGPFVLDVETARLTSDGMVAKDPPLAGATGVDVALAGDGSGGALLAWSSGAIVGLRLSDTGAAIEPAPRALSAHMNAEEVRAAASDGDNFLVLWSSNERDLFGARVTPLGTVLDAGGIAIPGQADEFDVVFDGENHLLVGLRRVVDSDDQCHAVRIRPDGTVLEPGPTPLPMCIRLPALAYGDAGVLLVGTDCEYDSLLGAFGFSAVLLDPADMTVSAVHKLTEGPEGSMIYAPVVAFDGENFLAAWFFGGVLVGQRLGPTGAPLGPSFAIAEPPPGTAVHDLSLHFGADVFLVLWADSLGLHATFVAPDGSLVTPQSILIAPPEVLYPSWSCRGSHWQMGACPRAVFADDRFVVTWRTRSGESVPETLDLAVAELEPSGVLHGPVALSAAPEGEGGAALAVNDHGDVIAAYTRFVADSAVSSRRAHARILKSPFDLAAGSSGEGTSSSGSDATSASTFAPGSSGEAPAFTTDAENASTSDPLAPGGSGDTGRVDSGGPDASACSLTGRQSPPKLLVLLALLARRRRGLRLVPRPGHFDPSSRRDPTGWQGARRAHIGQYVTDEQRGQRGGEQAREGRMARSRH